MKTKSLKLNRLVILFTIFFYSSFLFSQTIETSEIITREFDVIPETSIQLTNRNDDIIVKAWDKNIVQLETKVIIHANEQEDIDAVLHALRTYKVPQSPNQLDLNTRFYKDYQNTIVFGKRKNKMTLQDGTTVQLKKLKLSYVLFVPRNNHLLFNVKYCNLNLPDLSGKVEIQMYSGDIEGGNIDNNIKVNLKYSSLILKSIKECKFDIYDSKIELAETGDLNLKSKYSEIKIDKSGMIEFDSYTDKIKIEHLDALNGEAKYSSFELGDFKKGKLDIYDCNISAGKTEQVYMSSKYSKIIFRSVMNYQFHDSYDDKLEIGFLNEFDCKSKYTSFEIDNLGQKFILDGYNDKLIINQIDLDFSELNIDGKYITADLRFVEGAKFKMNAQLSYPNFDFPEGKFRMVRSIKESSKMEYLGYSNGALDSVESTVSFDMYDGNVEIKL